MPYVMSPAEIPDDDNNNNEDGEGEASPNTSEAPVSLSMSPVRSSTPTESGSCVAQRVPIGKSNSRVKSCSTITFTIHHILYFVRFYIITNIE